MPQSEPTPGATGYDNLDLRIDQRIATLTVDRPDRLNALNRRTLEELEHAVDDLVERSDVAVVVVTGRGDKAFVAGADIAEMRAMHPTEAADFSALGQRLLARIESAPKPFIAAINGFALGGGLELALACHVRLAAEGAKLGLPEIRLGLIPGFGGTQRLARQVGRGRALAMMLTGDSLEAEAARECGLVQEVAPSGALRERAHGLAGTLAGAAPHAVRGILAAVDRGLDAPLETGLALENARFALCCATEDMKEGTRAFLEKRAPEFSGR